MNLTLNASADSLPLQDQINLQSKHACKFARDYARKLKIIPHRPSEDEKIGDAPEDINEEPKEEEKE